MSALDWSTHDTTVDPANEWGDGDFSDFSMGAEAMRECGLKAEIKGYDVHLLEYSGAQSTVSIGLDRFLVEYKEMIELRIISENLNLSGNLKLRGIVVHLGEEDELGKIIVMVLMLQNSKDEFRKIREAVDQRQREVLSFFRQVRGVG